VLGVIQVINKKGGKTFSQEDVNLLQSLSSGAALALQNARYAQRLLQEERIRSELMIAHQIQQGILPGPFAGQSGYSF
jgi:sigma-B regulation protein RsbU (phosphoserine phosphatase)